MTDFFRLRVTNKNQSLEGLRGFALLAVVPSAFTCEADATSFPSFRLQTYEVNVNYTLQR